MDPRLDQNTAMLMCGCRCVFVPEPAGRNASFSSDEASGSSGKKDKVSVCCAADHHMDIVVCIVSEVVCGVRKDL